MTESSRNQTKARKVLFLQEAYSVPRTLNISRWNTTATRKVRKYS